jgi:thiol-disulfide isomerase/thioredoxin
MDRLSTVKVALVALGALATCDSKGSSSVAPAQRTDGAKVRTGQAVTTASFCDIHAADDHGAAFRWPELASGSTAPAAPTSWRWINVWATWCKPCIEEMPRLLAWRDQLAARGKPVELTFVSVDDADAEVEAFRKMHPETPPSIRVANADKRAAWLGGVGLGDGAIPIQLFVSPANRLRCARAGGIRDNDFPAIEQLLAE